MEYRKTKKEHKTERTMNIYEERPETVTTKVIGGYITYVYLDVRELTEEELVANGLDGTQQSYWTAQEVSYKHEQPLSESDYGPMVTAIVRSRYSADDVEAIILNNQKTDRSDDNEREFRELQAWRAQAKESARLAIGLVA